MRLLWSVCVFMYACMRACVCIYILSTCAYMCAYSRYLCVLCVGLCVHVYVCLRACICVKVYVCLCLCDYICVSVCAYEYTLCVCRFVHVYVGLCVCVHVIVYCHGSQNPSSWYLHDHRLARRFHVEGRDWIDFFIQLSVKWMNRIAEKFLLRLCLML